MRHRYSPLTVIFIFALSVSGCSGNDSASTLDLGSVSIGQQLIDLKTARDAGAVTGSEYRKLKADLLSLVENASPTTASGEQDESDKRQSQDDEESGFLF